MSRHDDQKRIAELEAQVKDLQSQLATQAAEHQQKCEAFDRLIYQLSRQREEALNQVALTKAGFTIQQQPQSQQSAGQ